MSPAAASAHQRPLRGVLLVVSALFLFACLDTTIKHLSADYPVAMIVWVRYMVHALLMSAVLLPREGLAVLRANRPRLVIVRALCLAAMSLFMGVGLKLLPVAEATALGFLAPMLVVLLARPLLGERIGWLRALAVVAGFGGVLLVARPGGVLDPFGVVMVLCAAGCATAYQLLSRVLSHSERTLTMLYYTALAGCVCLAPLLPWVWGGPAPGWREVLLFISLGLYGGIGHWLFTLAYRDAPASMLAPAGYAQLLWAALAGWVVFGHLPDQLALLGMLVIAASGLLVAWGAHRAA